MTQTKALWGFPIDEQLHADAQATADKIRSDSGNSTRRLSEEAAHVVIRLTEHGLQSYYHRPTEIVPLTPGLKRSADTGIRAIMGAIQMVIKQFFSKRNEAELRELSVYLEQMLWLHPERQEPHLVFSVHGELHDRALRLIAQVRTDEHPGNYIDDVIDALCEIVDLSIVNYYHQPTDRVAMGRVSKKTADLGINTAEKGIRKLIDKLLRELQHNQLVELSYHLESLIHASESR
ncbi:MULTISPECIES: hypothetical protein [Marinobacter]|uniref:Uncharacterized protein n=1 Tax=Marinobacter xestospongiae TaxID=994319 RepID=A0ABU3VUJ4_9GAMM|nr:MULTISPECIES: hypothetical protein [Marinobacter]MDV2077940.1 hypothetical protein [Marinobacter xestospongiae]UDL06376.1 hypothetical protein J2887_06335 [Marinobacter sp. CA1]